MKKNKILFMIYDSKVYIKKNNDIVFLPIDKDVISNGRINNIKKLIKTLKKSKLVLSSFFKIVNDYFVFIYFANYNNYELSNIKSYFKENGFENIELMDSIKLLTQDYIPFIMLNDNYYYIFDKNNKYVIPKEHDILKYANSKIISEENAYNSMSSNASLSQCFIVDSLPNYIFKKIC